MTSAAWEIFQQSHELVDPGLRSAIERLDPMTRAVCGYQLGFLDADGQESADAEGKGVRAALVLLSAQAADADPEQAVPAAVACELVHNFSLLHDDIMDGDLTRRHKPTAWTAFGTSSAILAGDALLSLANEVLAEAGTATVSWAVQCLNAATRRLIAGQAADLAFESRDDVPLAECQEMAAAKTGALLGCSASLGAVLVDAPARLAQGLGEFGCHLGMAFQLVDDLLGIWGSPERTGKPICSDLRARKKTLPVVAAMSADVSAARQLRAGYKLEGPLTDDQLADLAALIEETGGRAWTVAEAERESARAIASLDALQLAGPVRDRLVAVTLTLCNRDF